MNLIRIFKGAALAALTAAVLAACGGGDSAPAPAAAATSTVSGTAATGAAIASGTVTLKCVSGTTTAATTGTDGSFTVDVTSVTLPCVAKVEYKNAAGATAQLYSLITAAGTANITPLTNLLVAKLSGGSAASAFDGFTATTGKALTAAQIKTAADAVKAYLVTLGVDVTNFPADPIGTKFTAKNGSTDGDAVDKLLDALKTKLGTKSLADAETEINKSASTGSGSGNTANTLTVIGASNSARNGSYIVSGAQFPGTGTDFGFNGHTSDGKFEGEVLLSASGAVKQAHLWYSLSGDVIKFFGCDNADVKCLAISYNATTKIITFNGSTLQEVTTNFGRFGPDMLVPSGESIVVNGTLSLAN
jgi:hypothetical protein